MSSTRNATWEAPMLLEKPVVVREDWLRSDDAYLRRSPTRCRRRRSGCPRDRRG
jgi:hypothetical protein